jgi:hypothetical protein
MPNFEMQQMLCATKVKYCVVKQTYILATFVISGLEK